MDEQPPTAQDWSELSASAPNEAAEAQYYFRSTGIGEFHSLRPTFLGMKKVTIQRDHLYPLHRHKEYELVAVLKGLYRCSLNHHPLQLGPGEVLLVKPGDLHQPVFSRGQQQLVVHFQLASAEGLPNESSQLFAAGVKPANQRTSIDVADTLALLEAFERESEIDDPFSSRLQDALMEGLFWKAVRSLPPESRASHLQRDAADQHFKSRLLRFLANRLHCNLSLDEIAQHMDVSKRTLSKRSHEVLGLSPMRCFSQMRMRKASLLLQRSSASVKQIAYQMGFNDPFQFSRAFKRATGRSPSQLRHPPARSTHLPKQDPTRPPPPRR